MFCAGIGFWALIAQAAPTVDFVSTKADEAPPEPVALIAEGSPVPAGAERRLGTPVLAHRQGVVGVAISPTRKVFASIGRYEGGFALWDLETGTRLGRYDRVGVQAQAVAFSSDGRFAATADESGVAIWDLDTKKAVHYTANVGDGLRSIVWSPDGAQLFVGDDAGQVHRLSPTGEVLEHWIGPTDTSFSEIAVSPDGQKIAASGLGGAVWVWAADGTPLLQAKGTREGVEGIAFSSDGASLFVGLGADPALTTGRLKVWDLRRLRPRKIVLDAPVISMSGSSSRTVVALADGQVVSLNPLSGEPIESVRPRILPAVIAVDDERVVAGASGGKLAAFGRLTGKAWFERSGPQEALTDIAWSPDGSRVAASSGDGSVTLWDANAGEQKRALFGHEEGAMQIGFSPGGDRLLTSSGDGSYRLWDVEAGAVFKYWGDRFEGEALAWSTDGSAIAIGGEEGSVHVLSTSDFSDLASYQHPAHVEALAFAPDGAALAVAMHDNVLGVWRTSTNAVDFQRKLDGVGVHMRTLAWSDDGKYVATSGESGKIMIWNSASETPVVLDHGDQSWGAIPVLALDWDGDRLVSAGADGTIAVWNPASGEKMARWRGHDGAALGVAISPDHRRLASAGEDGTVVIWTMP